MTTEGIRTGTRFESLREREFQTLRAATLKLRAWNEVRTNGADSRLVFESLCTKPDERINMPFGGQTGVSPRNFVLDGIRISHRKGRNSLWGLRLVSNSWVNYNDVCQRVQRWCGSFTNYFEHLFAVTRPLCDYLLSITCAWFNKYLHKRTEILIIWAYLVQVEIITNSRTSSVLWILFIKEASYWTNCLGKHYKRMVIMNQIE